MAVRPAPRQGCGDWLGFDLAAVTAAAELMGDAIEHYRKFALGKSALAYCVTVAHAEAVASQFRRAGFRAAVVHGKTPSAERDRLIVAIATGAGSTFPAWPWRSFSAPHNPLRS